jgi:hypothetical protein
MSLLKRFTPDERCCEDDTFFPHPDRGVRFTVNTFQKTHPERSISDVKRIFS